jgi:Calx-beta domain-containing protein
LTLSAPVSQSVTVLANPASGTANVNEDFTSFFPMQVIFPPGRTSQTFAFSVVGDRTFEDDETFTLNLVDPTNATIERSQGHGIIKNDDPFPSIAIADLTLSESPTGTTPFNFLVTASNPSSKPITVQFATADGTAHAGGDYVQTAGTLTLSPLTTSETIPVPVNGDLIGETSKTFFVNLTNPTGATLANSQALGTILDYQLPVLLTEEGSQRAAAIELVHWLRDPFPLTKTIAGVGLQTRISLFALNIPPVPVGDLSRVTVHAEDELGNTYFVPIEFIGPVAGVDNLSQLIVRLPAFVGNANELRIKLIVLGGASNTASIRIAAP